MKGYVTQLDCGQDFERLCRLGWALSRPLRGYVD